MGNLRKIKYNCKDAQETCLKVQAGNPVGINEWLRMKYHLIYCKYCKWFIKQSGIIDKALDIHTHSLEENPPYTLTDDQKQMMQKKVDDLYKDESK